MNTTKDVVPPLLPITSKSCATHSARATSITFSCIPHCRRTSNTPMPFLPAENQCTPIHPKCDAGTFVTAACPPPQFRPPKTYNTPVDEASQACRRDAFLRQGHEGSGGGDSYRSPHSTVPSPSATFNGSTHADFYSNIQNNPQTPTSTVALPTRPAFGVEPISFLVVFSTITDTAQARTDTNMSPFPVRPTLMSPSQ